jgi:cell division protein FtsI/penicillin-binding protein 2
MAPAMNPKFLAAVIVDQPEGEIYGGSVAAPAFGEIAAFSLPYLGVPQE